MWTDSVLLAIFRRFPARDSIFKPSQGRAQAEYERRSAIPFFRLFDLGIHVVTGKDVLDLGSGFGSQAVQYCEAGAAAVSGLEVDDDKVRHSRIFAEQKNVADRVSFRVGRGEALPYSSDAFDLITMDDVLEHVVSPLDVLRECYRVLRPGGVVYAVFPPYYSFRGGSHLEGYLTSVSGLNLLFPTSALKSAGTLRLNELAVPWRRYLRDEPTDKLWNQNGLTVRQMRRLLDAVPFQRSIRYIGFRDRRRATTRRALPTPIYWPFEWSARVPLLREALCSRVALKLSKSASSPRARGATS